MTAQIETSQNSAPGPARSVDEVLSRAKKDRRVADLVDVLQELHPGGPPTVVMRDSGKPSQPLPLAEVLVMRNGWRYNPMLPALALVYGSGPAQPAVQQQMRETFDKLLMAGSYVAFRWADELWDSMHFWGGQDLGQKIWRASSGLGGSVPQSMMQRHDMARRMEQLHDLGANLDEPTFKGITMSARKFTALEKAIVFHNADVVGVLLTRGCDPLEPFEGMGARTGESLVHLAEMKARDPKLSFQPKRDAAKIPDMLRAAIARCNALQAIEELRGPSARVERFAPG